MNSHSSKFFIFLFSVVIMIVILLSSNNKSLLLFISEKLNFSEIIFLLILFKIISTFVLS